MAKSKLFGEAAFRSVLSQEETSGPFLKRAALSIIFYACLSIL